MLVNTRNILLLCFFSLTMASCVSSKKFKSQVARYDSLKTDYTKVEDQLRTCLTDRDAGTKRNEELQQENEFMKQNYTSILNQLRDLSVLSSTQAESIKKSMENLNTKDAYIKDLQISMSKKDSLNMALVMNLKGALKDINDEDVQIKVEGSAVFISISDKMLFKSGSYEISSESKNVLGKVADVIKAQPCLLYTSDAADE